MDFESTRGMSGLMFPEGPRWRDGLFWFSDILAGQVHAMTPEGKLVESFDVPGEPSGLGWLPGGDMLVVSRVDLCLYRRHGGVLTRHADLRPVHSIYSNDMVVDRHGRAYVGSVGFDFNFNTTPNSIGSALALVHPDGRLETAASDLKCPNGTAVTADGRTLIVAESMARRLTAFDIGADGKLSNRRVFAELDYVPDGICLDEENCVWVAAVDGPGVIRVAQGGEIRDRVAIVDGMVFACVLGGADRRTLMICAGVTHHSDEAIAARAGRIEFARVAVPGAGLP